MQIRLSLLALIAPVAFQSPAVAVCKLAKLVELQVTMDGQVPLVPANINGTDVLFIVDSGAFWSLLSPSAAANFKLRDYAAPPGFYLRGVAGSFEVRIAVVDKFRLANIPPMKVQFLVGGNEHSDRAVGLLGQNVFRLGDVEYDLANGVIRLMHALDCPNANFAYWTTSNAYSAIKIEPSTARAPHTTGSVAVNGVKLSAIFDTGSSTSLLSRHAAEKAGVNLTGDGVVLGNQWTGGGRKPIQTYIVPVASFAIGEEVIKNTHLRVAGTDFPGADMLVGADFFLSHRIYVASSQRMLFFTYNGGPVFNLDAPPQADAAAAAAVRGAEISPLGDDGPTDAASYARRGTAFAARHDYERAIADLTQACTMDPGEASYFYERGQVRWAIRQFLPASADFDEALRLKPDDPAVLVTRARLRASLGDRPGAETDLETAARLAPNNTNLHFEIGQAYVNLDEFPAAVAQYDWWIATHRDDGKMASVLNSRCWARALLGQELDKALADCDSALKKSPATAPFLDSRALVRLRLGDYLKSIADYDEALRLNPRSAWSLYGRGVAKLRLQRTAEGQADIAAATAIYAPIAERVGRYGIVP